MSDEDDVRSRTADPINENLRRVYRELVEEEIPDRFKALLEQLKDKDAAR